MLRQIDRCRSWNCLLTAAALGLAYAAFGSPARAAVEPHRLFSPGAVLQQGMPVPVWGKAKPGEAVTVSCAGQEAKTTADAQGNWMVRLAPLAAGGPHELVIQGENKVTIGDVLVGEVWIASGQSNMQWSVKAGAEPERTIAEATHPFVRLLTVPRQGQVEPQSTADIAWARCTPESIGEFSAVAYHFGRHLHEALGVPVGLINTSYGGTPAEAWTTREKFNALAAIKPLLEAADAARANYAADKAAYDKARADWEVAAKAAKDAGKEPPPQPQAPAAPEHPHKPTVLYNAMIHPLLPYAMRGAIWYQGESNAGRAAMYRTLFPAMISSWREAWGQGDFPFLFVQLAPFMKIVDAPGDSAWAELRDAQLHTSRTLVNTGMAVITDVGDENDIHPKAKEPVGRRLALAARALAYGEPVEYSGPLCVEQEIRGNQAVLHFSHVGYGLRADGAELRGFAVAGSDGKFVNAQARIDGARVLVWSADVPAPRYVRYGWANFPLGNLWNSAGLPASPFRTDDLPLTTAGQ